MIFMAEMPELDSFRRNSFELFKDKRIVFMIFNEVTGQNPPGHVPPGHLLSRGYLS